MREQKNEQRESGAVPKIQGAGKSEGKRPLCLTARHLLVLLHGLGYRSRAGACKKRAGVAAPAAALADRGQWILLYGWWALMKEVLREQEPPREFAKTRPRSFEVIQPRESPQRSLPRFPLPEWLMKALRHVPGLKRPTSLTQKFTKPSLAPFDRANWAEFNRRHKANATGTFKAIQAHGDGFRKEAHRIGTGAKIEGCSEQPSSGQQKSFKDIEPGRSAPHRSYVIRKKDRTRLENPRRT